MATNQETPVVSLPKGKAHGKELPKAPPATRWTVRRTLSFVLIASGVIWIALGLAIRLFVH